MVDEINVLKKEIEELKTKLKETEQESRQYLQNVAHQLTAPLGAIKWNIESLQDENVPIKRKQILLRSIYSQATILVHLIKNFSLMSNLEADHELGQFREQPEPIDVKRLCINLSNDFQPQAQERKIKIIVDDDSFKKIFGEKRFLSITKNLVAQAISNIIENAVKYSDSYTNININCEKSKTNLFVNVENTGLPILSEEIPRLTERRFRGKAAKQKFPAGTGIGLFLASRVMDLHGGRIEIRTTSKSNIFSLVFPTERIVTANK